MVRLRYICTTEISSGYKTTDLLERKPLKDLTKKITWSDLYFKKKITQAAVLVKAGGKYKLGYRIQGIAKTWVLDKKIKSSQKLASRTKGAEGSDGAKGGESSGR